MNKTIKIFLLSTVLLGFGCSAVFAQGLLPLTHDDAWLYNSGIREYGKNNRPFAFLFLHSLVNGYPGSRYLENSLFAIGVYHFQDQNFADAAKSFSALLDEFPDSQSTVFAMAYLLKIAQRRDASDLTAGLEKAIATFHKLSLVFRDSKEFTYLSAFGNKYKAVYYIDKVEFYKDGELFAQVSY